MVVPAVLYVVTVNALGDSSAATGWGIPMATDIAFAMAVLAIVSAVGADAEGIEPGELLARRGDPDLALPFGQAWTQVAIPNSGTLFGVTAAAA